MLDMDATLIGAYMRDALRCYKGFNAYQRLNCWLSQQGAILFSQFRNGNAPARHSRKRADYRFLAIHEAPFQLALSDASQRAFSTQEFAAKGACKLFGVTINRKDTGEQVIWRLHNHCSQSEEVRSVMKADLACGRLPSGLYGANAAW